MFLPVLHYVILPATPPRCISCLISYQSLHYRISFVYIFICERESSDIHWLTSRDHSKQDWEARSHSPVRVSHMDLGTQSLEPSLFAASQSVQKEEMESGVRASLVTHTFCPGLNSHSC